ncbi:XVIPCD domain-containing protein [Stenotrophomonas sp.]|uniref:XVIPCD domain-containing protein n=1 Tax=Stenotrophomonas sp. TaxID=69392 RepID=UPI0028B0FD04|nr:XVIPCD domain-containing protein [Stenotrophomonas sp.]
MSGLTNQDVKVLESYVRAGNRELYWNYLSQLPGADGYGTLALGVVRNDSLPGAVANSYAQSYAREQHDNGSRFPNATLSERQWDSFGQTLLEQDLQRRQFWMDELRPDLALNLPGRDVMKAHDLAFEAHHLDPNCWTPRVLLQAARENSGPEKVEQIWKNMLDNENWGLNRAGKTGLDAVAEMGRWEGGKYVVKLTALEVTTFAESRAAVDPNLVGAKSFYSTYSEQGKKWFNVGVSDGHVYSREETNPDRISELNDTRKLRLERQEKATQFHEEDPYRTITPSPKTASIDGVNGERQAPTRLADIGPGHPEYALLQQVREGVAAIDAKHGRAPDENSERLTASVMALTRQNGLDRADHVLLSAQTTDSASGRNVFVVQGDLVDPAHRRASMPTDVAVQTPVEQSLQRLDVAGQEQRALAVQTEQLSQQDQREVEARSVRVG